MTDSYLVSMNDPETFKVGEKAIFKGEAGLKVDSIELIVDGFSIGEVGFGRASGDRKLWELEYTFNGSGKGRRLQLFAKAGDLDLSRMQYINVLPKEEVKPGPVGTYKLKIVESDIRHAVRWNNDLVGVIWHTDAGRPNNDPTALLEMGVRNGYTYWALTPDGTYHATTSLREFGFNAGMYRHKNHLGVEISSVGKLTKVGDDFFAWFDLKNGIPKPSAKPWPKDQVRYFEGSKTQVRGHYAKLTQQQEDAMFALCAYLKKECPKFRIENVVDHSECMAEMGWYGEKSDVGGSLSMTMEEFRARLKEQLG